MNIRSSLITACMLLVSYGCAELMSLAVYSSMFGTSFSFSEVNMARAQRQQGGTPVNPSKPGEGAPAVYDNATLHPYLGFVRTIDRRRPVNELLQKNGFLGEGDPFLWSSRPNVAIVGITGGSVAEELFMFSTGRNILRDSLQKLPAFANKQIIFTMLGMRSYAQPQQLFAVTYYLFQGGRLDLLINLDGNNEVYNYAFNVKQGVFPLYPNLWRRLLANSNGSDFNRMAEMAMWQKLRIGLANVAQKLRYSVTAGTTWALLDSYVAIQLARTESALNMRGQEPYYLVGSDALRNASPETLNELAVNSWMRGSEGLYQLSQAYNFTYLHFLQPSQYLEGTKKLTSEEMAKAYIKDGLQHVGVRELYPVLQQKMVQLREQNIKVESLTDIYRDVGETLYMDPCCHTNIHGKLVLAQAMAKRIPLLLAAPAETPKKPAEK